MSQKVAYVTGGMGGIGTAICQRLHREGFTVIAGLLDLLEMTSTEAFGAIGAIVPGTRVRMLARVCRRARAERERKLHLFQPPRAD
jgi:NAD(P)-dependent dehydrogenase (short-subunit alcohol dehydrogenase family)